MSPGVAETFRQCEARLLSLYDGNGWFIDTYWPMNRPRLLKMLEDVVRLCPPKGNTTLIDVGCGTGYMSYVFAQAGYVVTGVDGYPDKEREQLFTEARIRYINSNFNELSPLAAIPSATYDVMLCGEVIEHILNHPQGFVDDLGRILRSECYVIVTTPNPSTLMNAVRLLRGRYSLWGTHEFITTPKINGGTIISSGGIHYREFTAEEVRGMLDRGGFDVLSVSYLAAGPNAMDGHIKRVIKGLPIIRRFLRTRILGSTQYHIACKRP